jgi:hypothetical protein
MRCFVLFTVLCSIAAAADLAPDEIIQKFAAKEAAFRKARENYTYRQSVKVEELDGSGNVEGKWEEVQDVTFGPNKQREEKVTYAPMNTLHLLLTPQDLQDLRSVQPFVLTTEEIGQYDIQYGGKEKLEEINCYKFSVKPKKLLKDKRYFEGDIWVDDQDLQIVKTYGKGVGLLKRNEDNQFPRFETYREQIDGKYWFPTYTIANDTLHFKDNDVRIKQTIRYEDYKQFKSDVKITFGDAVDDKDADKQKPPVKKQQ